MSVTRLKANNVLENIGALTINSKYIHLMAVDRSSIPGLYRPLGYSCCCPDRHGRQRSNAMNSTGLHSFWPDSIKTLAVGVLTQLCKS